MPTETRSLRMNPFGYRDMNAARPKLDETILAVRHETGTDMDCYELPVFPQTLAF